MTKIKYVQKIIGGISEIYGEPFYLVLFEHFQEPVLCKIKELTPGQNHLIWFGDPKSPSKDAPKIDLDTGSFGAVEDLLPGDCLPIRRAVEGELEGVLKKRILPPQESPELITLCEMLFGGEPSNSQAVLVSSWENCPKGSLLVLAETRIYFVFLPTIARIFNN